MRKISALFLISLLIISAFASCGKKAVQIQNEDDTKAETLIGEDDDNTEDGNSNTDGEGNGSTDGEGSNTDGGNNNTNGGNSTDGNGGNSGTAEGGDSGNTGNNSNSDNNGNNGDGGNNNTDGEGSNTDGDNNGNNNFPSTYTPINSIEELKEITLSGDYYLNGNIDMNGAEWTPIGTEASPFTGNLDGNGYTISNFVINDNSKCVGLFGANDGTVQNLKLKDFAINVTNNTGSLFIGSVVGHNNGSVKACSAEGTLSGTVTSSVFESSVAIGGIIGYNNAGTVEECFANCTVNSNSTSKLSCAGGLIGFLKKGNVTNCYATGDVKANYNALVNDKNSAAAGGLIGHNSSEGIITNCYASGTAKAVADPNGVSFAGGLIGSNMSTVINCYALGDINAIANTDSYSSYGGALCGYIDPDLDVTITNSYYSNEQTVTASSPYTCGTKKTLDELKSTDFHTSTLKWSSEIWSFTEGALPTLKALTK